MKIFIWLLVICFYFSKLTFANQVPEGLNKILKEYSNDSSHTGFQEMKKFSGCDKTINVSDIHLGTPVELFTFINEKIRKLSDSEDLDSFIVSTGEWEVPVYAKGLCIYTLKYKQKAGCWYAFESTFGAKQKDWDRIRKKWPENEENELIKIEYGSYTMLHFPKKAKGNLTYLYVGYDKGIVIENDFQKFGDKRMIFSEMKAALKESDEYREKNNNDQNAGGC